MLLMLVGMVGCQQEILQVMGAVTGIVVSAHPAASVADVVGPAALQPQPVEVAAVPSAGPDAGIAPADAAEAAPDEATLASAAPATTPEPAQPRPPPEDFNPISMPQGPRDSPGVRWEGVKGKTSNTEIRKDTPTGR